MAALTGQGSIPPTPSDKGAWLEATVDLAARGKTIAGDLAPARRSPGRARGGQLRRRCPAECRRPYSRLECSGKVSTWPHGWAQRLLTLPEPATLVAKIQRNQTATKLERLDVQSSFLTATGQGDLDAASPWPPRSTWRPFASGFVTGSISVNSSSPVTAGSTALYKRQGQEYRASVSTRRFATCGSAVCPWSTRSRVIKRRFEGTTGGPVDGRGLARVVARRLVARFERRGRARCVRPRPTRPRVSSRSGASQGPATRERPPAARRSRAEGEVVTARCMDSRAARPGGASSLEAGAGHRAR